MTDDQEDPKVIERRLKNTQSKRRCRKKKKEEEAEKKRLREEEEAVKKARQQRRNQKRRDNRLRERQTIAARATIASSVLTPPAESAEERAIQRSESEPQSAVVTQYLHVDSDQRENAAKSAIAPIAAAKTLLSIRESTAVPNSGTPSPSAPTHAPLLQDHQESSTPAPRQPLRDSSSNTKKRKVDHQIRRSRRTRRRG